MPKHQKEKQYLSAREYRQNNSIRNGTSVHAHNHGSVNKRLPFHCCSLSLNPYTQPMLVLGSVNKNHGVIFDKFALMEHVMQFKKDPVSGDSLQLSDLIELKMDRAEEGGGGGRFGWQCPVLCKKFTDYSKVVAIMSKNETVAHVLSYEALLELNYKANNMENLITGEPFSKKDVVWLQDPDNQKLCQLRDITNFDHIRNMRKNNASRMTSGENKNIRHSVTASRVMNKIKSSRNKSENNEENGTKRGSIHETEEDWESKGKRLKIFSEVSSNSSARLKSTVGLTSTVMASVELSEEPSAKEKLEIRFEAMRKLKKKGYVQLQTNIGNIMLELDCDIAPRTTSNFLGLVKEGKYNGVKFHRKIKKFMIQCGSKKKDSYFGGTFKDEFDDRLKHSERGILAMANAGAHTNKDQFYITFQSASHLDKKHSVFGRLIDGFDVLDTMEVIPTDKNDKPVHDIKIIRTEIAIDPSDEAINRENNRKEEKEKKATKEKAARVASALGSTMRTVDTTTRSVDDASTKTSSIGKYLASNAFGHLLELNSCEAQVLRPTKSLAVKSSKKKTKFGDFSSW